MKIVFLLMTGGLANRGIERVFDLFAHKLSSKHKVTLIQSGPIPQAKKYQVMRVYPLSEAPAPAPQSLADHLLFRLHLNQESRDTLSFTRQALPLINKLNPDVIIAGNGSLQIKHLRQSKLRAKILAFAAAGMGHHDKSTLLAEPDIFVSHTQTGLAWAKRYATNQTKLVCIPNPVEQIPMSQVVEPLSLPRPIVMTVGALTKYKRIVELSKALQDLPVSHLIIGDGDESASLAKVLSCRQYDFRWIRQVDPSQLSSYYQGSDVFCFTPESHEAYGLVYLEAMQAGLPIVATNDAVRREIIGSQGIFVDPYDNSSIISGVNQAIHIGKIDYSDMLKKYQLSVVTKQLELVLNEIIK